ncbi:MAG: class I SAM-dependent methyltransferase [Acidobacteriota bacterium]|nr:class I SAM-dependent methyltransferase [Acidobacteriota bacterium]
MSAQAAPQALDPSKLQDFLGKAVNDMGAAIHSSLIVVGERLGLYKAMAGGNRMTAAELAQKTGTHARYVQEWLNANAASGYVTYHPEGRQYSLNPEQIFTLANEDSPAYLPGFFIAASSVARDLDKLENAFRTGNGVGWHEHHATLFEGTEKFFRPGYNANLVASWIPSLEGVEAKLQRGARVADVGCGHGASTIIMAKAYPESTFFGFDYHPASIERARKLAAQADVADRITFEVTAAKSYPGKDYDLIAFFDCLHDMGDPVGAAKHVYQSLAADGTWMIVEPFAHDDVEKNLNPVGRIFYSASTMICTPASLAQEVGLGLGAQAGEARLREVVTSGGFRHFRRANETPFNLIFEARK